MSTAEHPIVSFWFGDIGDDGKVAPELQKRWWVKSADFDALCKEKFEADLQAVVSGDSNELGKTPMGQLAIILLCDQISRNIYRDTPQAFASDPIALQACLALIDSGEADKLPPAYQAFVYMPLMHSEDGKIQTLSIERFTKLAELGHGSVDFAERHKRIIDRFGRYPHRNAILSRESTAEELEFLKQPGSSF